MIDEKVEDKPHDGKISVTVNGKSVVLEGTKHTGTSIKKAAIEQGVNIKQDFKLNIELDNGKIKPVGDKEDIVVRNGQNFLAFKEDVRINVSVNHKPVILEDATQTGASIKEAAIEQGVNIKQDFVLSIELGSGKTQLIGDNEKIEVREGERFLAIENDDNS